MAVPLIEDAATQAMKEAETVSGMDDDDRLLFQLGRRGGAIRDLDELKNTLTRTRLEAARTEIQAQLPGGIPQYIEEIKKRFV